MHRMLRLLIGSSGLLYANFATAQFSSTQLTVLPFVQSNGVIEMSLNGNWVNQLYGYGPSRASINTQFQSYNGVPLSIGGYNTYTRTFNNQSVPFFGRAPFVGGLFRNRTQFQHRSLGNFIVRTTTVDPAGNPTFRPELYNRIPAPKMYGFIRPTSLKMP